MRKLVKYFSDGNVASIDQGLDYEAMGRYSLKRYIRIATDLVNRMQTIVVFQDDKGPQRPVFSGNPDPEIEPHVVTIRRRNGTMQVPIYRYYSNDLQRMVYQLKIPFPVGTTAEMVHRALIPDVRRVRIQGNTVYLESRH